MVEAVEGGSFKVEVNGDAEWVEEYTADDEGSEWRWEAADPATAAAAAIEGDDEGGEGLATAERWSGPLLVAGVSEARGIDVPGVDLVLIVGVPPSADSLLHLAGRTARNGAAGRAVVVGTPDDGRKLAALGPQLDIDLAAQTSHLAERDERLADTWRPLEEVRARGRRCVRWETSLHNSRASVNLYPRTLAHTPSLQSPAAWKRPSTSWTVKSSAIPALSTAATRGTPPNRTGCR